VRLTQIPHGEGLAWRPVASAFEAARVLTTRFAPHGLRPLSLLRAPYLDQVADASLGTRIWLAAESLQCTGSFKVRGAFFALAELPSGAGIVAASAGNHGVGVAKAARALGLHATVCVPRTAAKKKIAAIESFGATLELSGDNYDEAEASALARAKERNEAFVSPYDDPQIVLGNGGSVGFEIARALGRVPDHVLAPFGGGGLATGIGWALAHEDPVSAARRRVIGVQSESSPVMEQSLARGSALLTLQTLPTIAEGLEGGITDAAFARAADALAGVLTISEEAIASALRFARKELGLVLEGSAAAGLAPVLLGLPESLRGGDLVCVLTGRNIDDDRLARLCA
jgi:threonine dehydratase